MLYYIKQKNKNNGADSNDSYKLFHNQCKINKVLENCSTTKNCNNFVSLLQVEIQVIDYNESPPIFTQSTYKNESVREDVLPGTELLRGRDARKLESWKYFMKIQHKLEICRMIIISI